MEALAGLVQDYGWVAVLFLLVATNAGRIADWFERVVARVAPSWAEAKRLELEREERAAAAEQRHYLDTVLMLKDLILEYRTELDDSKLERRQLTNRLYEIVGQYERHDAQFVEVMRDMSEVIRGLMGQIRRMEDSIRRLTDDAVVG